MRFGVPMQPQKRALICHAGSAPEASIGSKPKGSELTQKGRAVRDDLQTLGENGWDGTAFPAPSRPEPWRRVTRGMP